MAVSYGANEVIVRHHLPGRPGRSHRASSAATGQGNRACSRCLAGVQEPTQRDDRVRCECRGRATSPRSTSRSTWRLTHARQRERHRAGHRARAARPAGLVRAALQGSRTDARPRSRAARGPSWGWPCCRPDETNLLLLDEPTNNLDPSSITAVGTMLGSWPGHDHRREPRARLRGGPEADPLPPPARGAIHPLARRVPRRRRDALTRASPTTPRSGSATRRRRRRRAPSRPWVLGVVEVLHVGLGRRRPRCPTVKMYGMSSARYWLICWYALIRAAGSVVDRPVSSAAWIHGSELRAMLSGARE